VSLADRLRGLFGLDDEPDEPERDADEEPEDDDSEDDDPSVYPLW
jgi:hypothetical protein